MKLSDTGRSLVKAFEEFEVIDVHEHLPPEQVRTSQEVDALTLFGHYTATDLMTSGMRGEDYNALHDARLPLDYRWNLLKPHLDNIRFGSYARAAFVAAKDLFGFDDINDDTYRPLSEAMQKNNTPGIYTRILRDKCRIRHALTQGGGTDYDGDLMVPVMWLDQYAVLQNWEQIAARAHELGERVTTLDDYILICEKGIAKWKREGVVGLKTFARAYAGPNRADAVSAFEALRCGTQTQLPDMNPLREYVFAEILRLAAEQELVVAIHAGMWGDFREIASHHMIPTFARNSRTRFDLYHMGMPDVRTTGVIGKNFPNVWLSMCWAHIISPVMTRSALDEYIDMVPVNKILGFGGDYANPVEKVYGHLVMAREDIAMVLGRRVDAGLMTEKQAIDVARKWFFDNPAELYGLTRG